MKASEKIRQEAKRMGVNLHDLAECVGWSDPTIYRHLRATSMNTLQPYLPPTSVEALKGDPPLPDVLEINGVKYRKVME